MAEYIVPLASLLLTVLSSLACLRFIFSRQGFFWIIPFIVSILLSVNNFLILFIPSASIVTYSGVFTLFPLFLSFFWYMMVVTFHYALKKKVEKNKFYSDMKKNYAEAKFLEKNEKRDFFRFTRRKKDEALNGAYRPEIAELHDTDLDYLD